MLTKIIVLLAMLAVLFSLFSALFHLTKGGEGSSQKSLKFLIWRLGFSIAIFLGLYLASFFGIIAPHGLPQAHKPATTSAPSANR
ncbi:MAG: twin transmembrane helix small protein [bacterium]|nr:twin transmembrane helix small protein [bacterium]